jgi:dihydrofolate reductase
MKAIAVIDKANAIGRGGKLLFRLPGDMAHFRAETLGKTIIMGRKTLESMPGGKPLKGRTTLVLSGSLDGAFRAADELLAAAPADAIVCGGGEVYRALLPYCDELILTEVDAYAEEPDTFFPPFREEFRLTGEEGPFRDGDAPYWFRRYERIRDEI